MSDETDDPAVITVYESEPGGHSVLWDQATGGVKVQPDGEWLMPSTWKGGQNE